MYPLLSTYTLPAFYPFALSAYIPVRVSHNIKHLHTLGVELIEAAELATVNQLLQPTGDAMATEEAIITAKLMATGEAEAQSVQTTRDRGRSCLSSTSGSCWTNLS